MPQTHSVYPPYQQPPPTYPGQSFPPPKGQPQPPYPEYQQQPYPDYQQQSYPGYQQYPQYQQPGAYDQYGSYTPPQSGDWVSRTQAFFDGLVGRMKQFVRTANPILLSSLVVLVVGLTIFTILAFQLGWIKTATPSHQTTATKDTTPVLISMLTVREGSTPHSAIISWVTNKYSSSQVEYGIWPYANTTTPIQNDPRTGVNKGVLTHEVGLTNLLPKTSYIYRAISYDKDGNKGVSPDMQFDTTP